MMDREVLIVGAGPTGLTMACQLLRWGVRFRIIDRQADRTHESRAFTIQARSMEIFQGLGLAMEFLKVAHAGMNFAFFIDGKKQVELNLSEFPHQTTPFPSIYSLSQAETERILIQSLKMRGISIERQKELLTFTQDSEGVEAVIKDHGLGKEERIHCSYLVGCDGAHSTVRHTIQLPFEGKAYEQVFTLVDAHLEWPFPRKQFMFFLSEQGILVYVPLSKDISRIMLASRSETSSQEKTHLPDLTEIERLIRLLTKVEGSIKLEKAVWLSRFRLHHRDVASYYQNRVFLAGDAAHIHSPIGGQGMNTGIQDATNLAWKLAWVLKWDVTTEILDTYETERHPVGKTLLKTTDRFFSLLMAKGFFIAKLRNIFLPSVISFLFSKRGSERYLFWFISQLNIRYHKSRFLYDIAKDADAAFKKAPQAGCRAPDAPIASLSLFDLLRNNAMNILFFEMQKSQTIDALEGFHVLLKEYGNLIQLHYFIPSIANEVLFQRYGVTSSAIYLIRPDGYIGFRIYGCNWRAVGHYLEIFFEKNPI